MNKVNSLINWTFQYLFFISVIVLVICYLRWFWIAPVSSNYPDTPAFIFNNGIILLIVYIFLTFMSLIKKQGITKSLMIIFTLVFLGLNYAYITNHMPVIKSMATYNGTTYIISRNNHGSIFKWKHYFYQLSKWQKGFRHESLILSGSAPYQIIYDDKKQEINIVEKRFNTKMLVYTDGDSPREYDKYANAQLGDHLYFLSVRCVEGTQFLCETIIYTLVECNMDISSCNSLPIRYVERENILFAKLKANEATNEIELYNDLEKGSLVFTYGEHPCCFVEGCEILGK